jgi:hypothetical protein
VLEVNVLDIEKEVIRLQDKLIKTLSQCLRHGLYERIKDLRAIQAEFIVPNDEFSKIK